MAELFDVSYQVDRGTHVELGRAVVLAADRADAERRLALAGARFTTAPVAGGLLRLEQRVVAPQGEYRGGGGPRGFGNGEREYRPAPLAYNCRILAVAYGVDEDHALKRVGHSVIDHCNGQPGEGRHVTRLQVEAEPRLPRVK
jgi:hypothetical protein